MFSQVGSIKSFYSFLMLVLISTAYSEPLSAADHTTGLDFFPIGPCVILRTHITGLPLEPEVTQHYLARGVAGDFVSQGGDADCSIPPEAGAVMVMLRVGPIRKPGIFWQGTLKGKAFGPGPFVFLVSFKPVDDRLHTWIDNTVLNLCRPIVNCAADFSLKTSDLTFPGFANVHVTIQVIGYFAAGP